MTTGKVLTLSGIGNPKQFGEIAPILSESLIITPNTALSASTGLLSGGFTT